MGNIETGKRGEQIAVDHLTRQGFRILARNVRFSGGEIDIVIQDPWDPWDPNEPERRDVAIVEVKTRSSTRFGAGMDAITPAKYARLRRLAAQWLHENPGHAGARIDVISILLGARGHEIEHLIGVLP